MSYCWCAWRLSTDRKNLCSACKDELCFIYIKKQSLNPFVIKFAVTEALLNLITSGVSWLLVLETINVPCLLVDKIKILCLTSSKLKQHPHLQFGHFWQLITSEACWCFLLWKGFVFFFFVNGVFCMPHSQCILEGGCTKMGQLLHKHLHIYLKFKTHSVWSLSFIF